MSDALDADFASFAGERTGKRCLACQAPPDILEWLNAKLDLKAAGEDPGKLSDQILADFITAKGFTLTAGALRNHRLRRASNPHHR